MLISPTEPKALCSIGTVSSLPEKYGADYLYSTGDQLIGVQRKEIKDLIASVVDGRLGKELAQMAQLDRSFVLIEGRMEWTDAGNMLGKTQWTRNQQYGLELSIQSRGCLLAYTVSLLDTLRWLSWLEQRLQQPTSNGMIARKGKTRGQWGKATNKEWAVYLLSTFEGVGPEIASRLFDRFGLPLSWTVSLDQLMEVEGVGLKTAQRILGALGSSSEPALSEVER